MCIRDRVTQVEMAPRLMLREDEDVSAYAQQALQADGVTVLTGHQALRWASMRTSAATTAKPRPCSPARAASTAASVSYTHLDVYKRQG